MKNLLKIKSIVTIALIVTFCWAVVYTIINGLTIPESLLTIVSMVVGYYFGTQKVKEN